VLIFCVSIAVELRLLIHLDSCLNKYLSPKNTSMFPCIDFLTGSHAAKQAKKAEGFKLKEMTLRDDAYEKPPVYEEPDDKLLELKIKCHNLTKVFNTGQRKIMALQNVNLNFHIGEITFIIGNSGSGKSTLIELLGGFLAPTEGYVEVSNQNVLHNVSYMRKITGFCPQIPVIFENITVEEHLRLCCMVHF